ncbi:MAG: hypothetical protein ABWY20_00475 [Mycobacterium sp.]
MLRELVLLREPAHHLEPPGSRSPARPRVLRTLRELVDGVIEAALLLRATSSMRQIYTWRRIPFLQRYTSGTTGRW